MTSVRNFLIIKVIDFIKAVQPTNIIIENVPQILTTKLTISDNDIFITDLIKQELEPLGYFINYKVCDACDYNTPQHRKRCIFLISRIRKWEFPQENKNWILLLQVLFTRWQHAHEPNERMQKSELQSRGTGQHHSGRN